MDNISLALQRLTRTETDLRVVLYPDPILLRPALPLDAITDKVRAKAEQMREVMHLEQGVGLAAPQVGWGVRLLLASHDGEPESTSVLVNPEIVTRSGGTEWGEEGCLSFPGIYGEVLRHRQVALTALDLDGNEISFEAEGFHARVLQHELDHLDGMVFISKMRPASKAENKSLIDELVRRFEARQSSTP